MGQATTTPEGRRVPGDGAELLVFSSDTHVGPPLRALRPYCPAEHLREYDDFLSSELASTEGWTEWLTPVLSDEYLRGLDRNLQTAGHHEPHARLRDYDRDGVAGGVIFHGSSNAQVFPFTSKKRESRVTRVGDGSSAHALELEAAGMSMYNRWLADFCSVEPERHVGLAYLPLWDIERSVVELEWCAEHGLRGVNFPAPGDPALVQPYEPEFDRLFAACASLDMTLTTHVGTGGQDIALLDATRYHFILLDAGDWGTRSITMLIIFGAFERHPNLKLVLTEVPGIYWNELAQKMDSIHNTAIRRKDHRLPRPPSEYLASNVWFGSSFMGRHEALAAIDIGHEDRYCWGSDYPHVEGTFTYSADPNEHPMTRLSLANTFHDLPIETVRKLTGENLLNAYPRLDRAALDLVARRIGITTDEIAVAPDLGAHPFTSSIGTLAFRTSGAWD